MSLRFQRAIKRLLDVAVAAFGLIGLSPVIAFLLGINTVVHGWPPVFVQRRPGLNGRVFRMLKLRSMTNARDTNGELLPDAERMTAFGHFLRKSSLDELPELWNVLVGDMSLVGPRALLEQYLPLYSPEQARRHEVRPGITGWAAVNGRNALSWPEKFAHDVWYVDNWSLALDFKVLARTVGVVLKGTGVAAEGSVTMPAFTGET